MQGNRKNLSQKQIKMFKKVKKRGGYAEIKGECESIRPFFDIQILHFWRRFYEDYV